MNKPVQSLNVHGNDIIARDEPPVCVRRYLAGESLEALALENPMVYREFYRWMLGSTKEQYADLVTTSLIDRIAEADYRLATSSNKLDQSRAQALCKFTRMDFERKRPQLYGSQIHVQQDTQVTVQIAPIPTDIPSTYRVLQVSDLLGESESHDT